MNPLFKTYFIIILSFWLNSLFSQNVFKHEMGSIYLTHLVQLKDSSFAGFRPKSGSAGGGSLYKINAKGIITDKIYNEDFQIKGGLYNILNSKDGFILCGETYIDYIDDGWGDDFLVQKIDYEGNIIWNLALEGLSFEDAIRTSDGHFLIFGSILEHPDLGYTDVVVYKINESGEIVWKKIIGEKATDVLEDVLWEYPDFITEIDDFYYLHYEQNYFGINTKRNVVVLKIDRHGESLWTINDRDNEVKLEYISSLFKLNNKIYFANSKTFELYELNADNGNYLPTNRQIRSRKVASQYINFETSCNELVVVEKIGEQYYFNKYKNIDEPYHSQVINTSWLLDFIKTLDGGYAFFNSDAQFIKTDCKGNYDFWDDECTNRLKGNDEVILYPNPTAGTVHIETNFSIRRIVAINYIGKELIFENYCNCNKQIIDLSEYTAGTYFLKIVGEEGFEIRKITKY